MDKNNKSPWNIKPRYLVLIGALLLMAAYQYTTTNEAAEPIITISAGDLARVYPTLGSKPFNVVMKNGSIETSRNNDIEELALDWHYYRKEIVRLSGSGNDQGAQEARANFQQINAWLSEYDEEDVSFILDAVAHR